MTYIEKLYDAIAFISKRHKEAQWVNLGPNYDFSAELKFIVDQPKDKENDYEWIYFSIIGKGSLVLVGDLNSLAVDLHLPNPEFVRGWEGKRKNYGPGIMFTIPDEWNDNYRNKEYIQENYNFPIPFWRCTDTQFQERVNHFNEIVSRFKT